jgi:flagellar biosynthesis/type III secretory pathway M-ring protein FliF/YscJ
MPFWDRPELWRLGHIVLWGILATFGILLVFRIYRRATSALSFIKPGSRVGDVQMMLGRSNASLPSASQTDGLVLREQARELSKTDPARAANLLRAWVDADGTQRTGSPSESAARR